MSKRLHINVRKTFPAVGAGLEVQDMLDFGDLTGAQYDNSGAAVANRAALVNYFSARAGKVVALAFAGPLGTKNKREPGTVYVDLAAGPIPVSLAAAPGISGIELHGPSKIIGINAPNGTTPIFDVVRSVSTNPRVLFSRLEMESNGAGLRLEKMGTLSAIDNCKIKATGVGAVAPDTMADLDTAGYGLKLVDCDGTAIRASLIHECGAHGLIADRWHAGASSQFQCWGNGGAGIKGRYINGTDLDIRCESNSLWGYHLRNCGSNVNGEVPAGGSVVLGEAGAWKVWCENNNRRDTTIGSTGHPFRQGKLEEGCARLRIIGRSGWQPNMVDIPHSVRLSNKFVSGFWIDPSITPATRSMKTLTPGDIPNFAVGGAGHNWNTQWTTAGVRPSVAMVNAGQADQRLDITLPAGCYTGAIGSGDFWQPMQPLGAIAAVAGDVIQWAARISVDTEGVNNSLAAEALSPRQTGWQFDITPDPMTSGKLSGAAMWHADPVKRWFQGRVTVDQARNVNLAIRLVISASQQFAGNQPNAMKIIIHDFLVYHIPK